MIHLDTSVLIDAFSGTRRAMPRLRAAVADGHRLGVSSLVLFEWRRGSRTEMELAMEAALLAPDAVAAFDESEARLAADIYRTVKKARGREIDIAIAACAMIYGASLWTLNVQDFADIPGIDLYRP